MLNSIACLRKTKKATYKALHTYIKQNTVLDIWEVFTIYFLDVHINLNSVSFPWPYSPMFGAFELVRN